MTLIYIIFHTVWSVIWWQGLILKNRTIKMSPEVPQEILWESFKIKLGWEWAESRFRFPMGFPNIFPLKLLSQVLYFMFENIFDWILCTLEFGPLYWIFEFWIFWLVDGHAMLFWRRKTDIKLSLTKSQLEFHCLIIIYIQSTYFDTLV